MLANLRHNMEAQMAARSHPGKRAREDDNLSGPPRKTMEKDARIKRSFLATLLRQNLNPLVIKRDFIQTNGARSMGALNAIVQKVRALGLAFTFQLA